MEIETLNGLFYITSNMGFIAKDSIPCNFTWTEDIFKAQDFPTYEAANKFILGTMGVL